MFFLTFLIYFFIHNYPLISKSRADNHLNEQYLKLDKLFKKCTFLLSEEDHFNKSLIKQFNKCKKDHSIQATYVMEVNAKEIHSTSRNLEMIAGWFCDLNKPVNIKYPTISNRHSSLICIRNENLFPENLLN